ncbi:MAG: hypothetical protein HYX69_08045 [Planctomycetia bacterium]|nr:hypothetical protein [Planctomycetia bacterium]
MTTSASWFLAGCLVLGQAEAPAADDLAPTVQKLVRQLDADQKAKRDEAERELVKLGTRVLPHLPAPDSGSAQVNLLVARIRTTLEELRAKEEVGATKITLTGNMPLADVLSAIEKQTGNKLVDYREQFNQQPDAKKLNVALEKADFWPALDQLLDQASMTTYGYTGEDGLALVGRAGSELPRYKRGEYAGAFRIDAMNVNARRDLRDPGGQVLRVNVEVAWEPRLRPIAISQAADAITATGDNGATLSPSGEENMEVSVNPGDYSSEMSLAFGLPPREMKEITSLKGQLSVLLPGPVETFRFEKVQPGAKGEQRRAGVKVILEQVRQNNLVWEVRLRVVFDKAEQALESHRTWVLHNEAFLESADKQPIAYAGLETTRQAENEVGVAYLFDVPELAGHSFVYKTPAVLMNAQVAYELHDVKLP